MTDSEYAFRWLLQPLIKRYGYNSVEIMNAAWHISGWYSKFAMLKGNDVRLVGEFIPYHGCYFSNMRFL